MQTSLDKPASRIKRGQLRKTNKSGESTIEKILSSARTVLVRDGIEKFTVERIAREAQITKGTLLYHFHDKEQLLERMMTGYVEHLEERLNEGIAAVRASRPDIAPELEVVAGFICWYRDFRRQNAAYASFGVSILSMSINSEKMRRPVLEWYRRVFARLRAAGNSDILAAVLMLEGLFYLRHLQLDMTTDEEIELILRKIEIKLGLAQKEPVVLPMQASRQ